MTGRYRLYCPSCDSLGYEDSERIAQDMVEWHRERCSPEADYEEVDA